MHPRLLPLLFSPSFHWRPFSPSIPDYFYPTFHYHNKTRAWKKKINSKRQRGQKPGFGRLIFIFSFLSSILLCLLFSFRSEKWKETCLFFQPVPHYGAFQVCSFVWGQPRAVHRPSGAAGWITQTDVNTSNGATDHSCKRPLPSVARTLHALISVAKQPMPRLNQQEQLPYRRHRREQYIQTCYHDTGQNVSLSADNQHAVRRLAAQSISTSLGLNVSRVTGVIFLSVKSLRSSSAFQTEATTRSVSELNVWPAIIHSQTIRVQMNELWSSRLAKYWISTSAGATMSM